ncbi:MAG: hypothetical protein AAFV25_27725, partial [Bacteroidota bacterium]
SEYPKIKEPIEQILEELTGGGKSNASAILRSQLGEYYPYYSYLRSIKDMQGDQARMPFVPQTAW